MSAQCRRWGAGGGVVLLLAVMLALLWRPMREDSATVDEPLVLTCGYAYWNGFAFRLNPEHPPLGQTVMAAPLLFTDVHWTREMEDRASLRLGNAQAQPWFQLPRPLAELFPAGRDDWYFWPAGEASQLADCFLFGGTNDADHLLCVGRWVAVIFTGLTALVVAVWLSRLAGGAAAVLGIALWVLNPLVLAYGHLIANDMSVALFMTLAVWAFSVFLLTPTPRQAAWVGLATGGALMMKFTALLLGPVFLALTVVWWLSTPNRDWRRVGRYLPLAGMVVYGVILLAYAPYWKPAPPISPARAHELNVPGWFRILQPVLVPPDFFKGIALQMAHAKIGHGAFFAGEWRMKGWWYYFPAALALKLPIPLLALTGLGAGLWLAHRRRLTFPQIVPWVAGLTYLGCGMAGTINIGVRYMLPLLPLLAVGTASQLAGAGRALRLAGWALTAWLAVVTVRAHPDFLAYCNEIAGGPANGYQWLVDSNYDWGQDVKRLKSYLAARGDPPVYLAFFGSPPALDYYHVRHTRVTATDARALTAGTLIVSASELMRPRWNWLRDTHQPVDRVGYTLFVYRLP